MTVNDGGKICRRGAAARRWRIGTSVALFMIGLGVSEASATGRTMEVRLKPDTPFTTLRGTIKGSDTLTYAIGAKAGQVASILFVPSNRSCYMNVFAPGRSDALLNGSLAGSNEFSGNLTTTGQYRVQVYLMRNAARRNEACRHKITFEIR